MRPSILREEIGGHVIVRTGRRIPGVVPIGGAHFPISVVRMAVGDATAPRSGARARAKTRPPPRRAHRAADLPRGRRVLVPACRAHEGEGLRRAEVVSPVYEGMLKEEMDAAAERHAESNEARS